MSDTYYKTGFKLKSHPRQDAKGRWWARGDDGHDHLVDKLKHQDPNKTSKLQRGDTVVYKRARVVYEGIDETYSKETLRSPNSAAPVVVVRYKGKGIGSVMQHHPSTSKKPLYKAEYASKHQSYPSRRSAIAGIINQHRKALGESFVMEAIDLSLQSLDEANVKLHSHLRKIAQKLEKSSNRLDRLDGHDYHRVADHVKNKDYVAARRTYGNMDTAARDHINGLKGKAVRDHAAKVFNFQWLKENNTPLTPIQKVMELVQRVKIQEAYHPDPPNREQVVQRIMRDNRMSYGQAWKHYKKHYSTQGAKTRMPSVNATELYKKKHSAHTLSQHKEIEDGHKGTVIVAHKHDPWSGEKSKPVLIHGYGHSSYGVEAGDNVLHVRQGYNNDSLHHVTVHSVHHITKNGVKTVSGPSDGAHIKGTVYNMK